MQYNPGSKTALGLDANIGALLCYLPVCLISLIYSIIVIATDKENTFVRFHAFQSLLLTVLYIVLVVAISLVGGVISAAVDSTIGSLFSLLSLVVIVGFLGAMIFGMIKGFQGQIMKLPVIGDMAEKWANS
ncbi:MAG: hypothetical protein IPM50_13555 [Acidobacteriota bacterium]|nr:MAG: hypothetical protein IPM50_13555 [Acidobacteriota bacterium]